MSLFEWTVRMVMLVLAGLVTLAILGSIHALSTDTAAPPPAGTWIRADRASPQPERAEQPSAEEMPATPSAEPQPQGGEGSGAGETAVAAAPPERDETERWFEAIAYALLALAGLVAIGLILLWQLLRQTKRLADAAELRLRGG